MSAAKRPHPAKQLRLSLTARRELGWSFDVAFTRGIADLRWDPAELKAWRDALKSEKETWRKAYHRQADEPRVEVFQMLDPESAS